MKNIITLFAGVLLLASCSAPKYSYYFDHYDYNSGKKKANAERALLAKTAPAPMAEKSELTESPLTLEKDAVVASTENVIVTPSVAPTAMDKTSVERKYSEMTGAEKKEFRKEVKTAIKEYAKAKRSGDHGAAVAATKAMDYNLKMAIIFGAVALTLSFFGGVNSVFWIISVVTLVIGVVFFIKWIAEQ